MGDVEALGPAEFVGTGGIEGADDTGSGSVAKGAVDARM